MRELQLLPSIQMTQQHINPALQILGIVGMMCDRRLAHHPDVMRELRRLFPPREIPIFESVIARSVRFEEAGTVGNRRGVCAAESWGPRDIASGWRRCGVIMASTKSPTLAQSGIAILFQSAETPRSSSPMSPAPTPAAASSGQKGGEESWEDTQRRRTLHCANAVWERLGAWCRDGHEPFGPDFRSARGLASEPRTVNGVPLG